jgi:hypothetical protein
MRGENHIAADAAFGEGRFARKSRSAFSPTDALRRFGIADRIEASRTPLRLEKDENPRNFRPFRRALNGA